MSRLLHNPKPEVKLSDTGPIFDHFVVVGADNRGNDTSAPKILYSFPENTE